MKKILVVEDEQLLREAYISILTKEGFQVTGAENGAVALDKMHQIKPDLILLDILMPKVDGLEFLQRANMAKNFPKTKVIAFSNLSSQVKLEQILELGAHRQILKASLSPKQLVQEVRLVLGMDAET